MKIKHSWNVTYKEESRISSVAKWLEEHRAVIGNSEYIVTIIEHSSLIRIIAKDEDNDPRSKNFAVIAKLVSADSEGVIEEIRENKSKQLLKILNQHVENNYTKIVSNALVVGVDTLHEAMEISETLRKIIEETEVR